MAREDHQSCWQPDEEEKRKYATQLNEAEGQFVYATFLENQFHTLPTTTRREPPTQRFGPVSTAVLVERRLDNVVCHLRLCQDPPRHPPAGLPQPLHCRDGVSTSLTYRVKQTMAVVIESSRSLKSGSTSLGESSVVLLPSPAGALIERPEGHILKLPGSLRTLMLPHH